MPETTYTYDIAADLPGGKVNTTTLQTEIRASSIVPDFHINTSGGSVSLGVITGGSMDIVFKDTLSAGDKTTLDGDVAGPAGGLLAAHVAIADRQEINVKVDQPVNADGIPYSIPKASGTGYILNDRDVLLRTAIVDPTLAAEDLKISAADHTQTPWEEATLVGVYKPIDPNQPNGEHEECTDQADADANATLSVYDYQALSGGNPISYEIRGGCIYVDLHVEGLGATPADREKHRIYVVAAPDIPLAWGGHVAFFDGYLAPWAQQWLQTNSGDAFRITYNPAAPPASIMRTWIFYPPGMKVTHIIRFNLYRMAGR